MIVHRAQVIKIAPNKTQAEMLERAIEASRFAWNWGIAKWDELHKTGQPCSGNILCALWTRERPDWTHNAPVVCPRRSLLQLQTAFKTFFSGVNRHPKPRVPKPHDGAYFDNASSHFCPDGRIYLSRVGAVRTLEDLRYKDGKVMSFTVKHEADGWYVSVQVDIEDVPRSDSKEFVGIDVGCKVFAAASDGTICKKPLKLKDLERHINHRQRLLSSKQFKSKNWYKNKKKVTRGFQRRDNIKLDTIHKFTAEIAKKYGTACLESLDIIHMLNSDVKAFRKGVEDSYMAQVLYQLKYKCREFIEINRWFPSTKTCSNCGNVKEKMKITDRVYICDKCGFAADRDVNAAINLLKEGIKMYTVGHTVKDCGEPKRLSEAVTAKGN